MKRKFYFIAAIFLAAFTADSFAQLTKIWDLSMYNFAFERLCGPGKLAIVSRNGVNQYMIDLTNGEIIYSTQYPEIVNFNYWGDRYYVHNINENIIREYDVRTKNLIGEVNCIPYYGDSTSSRYNSEDKILYFVKYATNEHLDSVNISKLFQAHSFSIDKSSFDGRYLSLFIYNMSPKYQLQHTQTLIYDKKKKEIVNSLPTNNDLILQFFNNSNLMAYAVNIKLPEDDKAYSYIRIYDPDKREVVKNIRVNEEITNIRSIVPRNDDKYILFSASPGNNVYFYDNSINEIIDFKFIEFPSPLYFDDSLYVTFGSFEGYKFNWNAVSVEDEPIPDLSVIYPNPTNGIFSIDFNIDISGITKIQLYDLSGRVVKNIENKFLEAGNHNLEIDISNLPIGQYNLTIETSTGTKSHKIMVSR